MRFLGAMVCLALLLVCPPTAADDDPDLPPCDTSSVTLSTFTIANTPLSSYLRSTKQSPGPTSTIASTPCASRCRSNPSASITSSAANRPTPSSTTSSGRRALARGTTLGRFVSARVRRTPSKSSRSSGSFMSSGRSIGAKAELVIQPPDGKTLVNLKTNFFTTTTEPRVQPVTIFGHTVDIEATPSDYLWRFGDGSTQSGTDSGAAYRRPTTRCLSIMSTAGWRGREPECGRHAIRGAGGSTADLGMTSTRPSPSPATRSPWPS